MVSSRAAEPQRAAVVWLVTIGIWLLELLKTSPLAADMRQKVLEELLRLSNGIGDEQQAPPQS